MSFFEDLQRGQAAAHAAHQRPAGPAKETRRGAGNDAGKPSPIRFGYYLNRKTGATGDPLLCDTALHLILFGLNGAGKQTRILTELYATGRGRSMFIVETKGTAALQTADQRRKFSDTRIICPFPVLGLKSHGWNPLRYFDPKSPHFLGDARALARAMIDIEAGTGKHWSESATGLIAAIIMWEVIKARREGRTPLLFNVRMMLTEPDKWEPYTGADGKPRKRLIAGLSLTAAQMIDEGGPIIASLVGRFVRPDGKDELASIQSTAATQTEFLLNPFIAEDLSKGENVDLAQLSQRPMSVYFVCAGGELDEARRWIRMAVAFAVRAHLLRPPKLKTLFVLDEYRATVGKLDVVKDNWALVREYGIQFLVCTQSALHLKALHGDEWEDFVGQAGAVATIGPPGDQFTADFFSKRCGVTTVVQAGFNVGDGVNSGDGANSGVGFSNSGTSSNQGSGRNYGRNTSGTFSLQQTERPAMLAQELMDMQPGEGRLWLQGMGTKSFPFFAPNYWQRDAPWVAAVKSNPYYTNG
jgi:type IV secretion system protein VirD4